MGALLRARCVGGGLLIGRMGTLPAELPGPGRLVAVYPASSVPSLLTRSRAPGSTPLFHSSRVRRGKADSVCPWASRSDLGKHLPFTLLTFMASSPQLTFQG